MAAWLRRCGLACALALFLLVLSTAASAEAAPQPQPLRAACAKQTNGQLRAVTRPGRCRRSGERAIRFAAANPVIACARRGAGVHVVGTRAACRRGANRPSLVLELPSAERHDFCAQRRTGRLRSTEHVPYPGEGPAGGGRGDRPAGTGRGPCKRDERRVALAAVDFPPDVEEDVATVRADGPAAIDVLANDRDPEGGAIRLAGVDRGTASGDVAVAADGGAVAYDPAGRFRALGAGASATERFTYTATDGKRVSEPAGVTVTVTGVNDAPTAVADAAATTEDAPVVLRPAANDADPDAGDAVIVAAAAGPGVTRNADGTVTFDPTGRFDALGAGERRTERFSYTATDGHGGTATAEVAVEVTGVDDAPALTASAGSAAFGEGGAPVAIDPALTVADPDSAQLDGATVTIAAGRGAGDVLGFADQLGISGSYDAAAGVLTLAGAAPVADYQAALRSVTFSATGANPSAAPRTIRIRAGDGVAATRDVSVATIDDAPVLAASGGAAAYTENDPAGPVDAGLTVADPDSPQLAGATITIAAGFVAGQDVLGFTPHAGIAGTYDALTGTLTLTGAATPAQYQAALRGVTYVNTSENPSGAPRTVQFVVRDGSAPSAAAVRTVSVAPVADPARLETSAGTAGFTEGGAPVAVDPQLVVTDADSDQLTRAEVEITAATRQPGDVLTFASVHGITGAYAGGTLELAGVATVAEYQDALRAVAFGSASTTPGGDTRTIRFRVADGGLASGDATRGVAVTQINAAPVVTTSGGSAAFAEDGPAVPVDPAVGVTDADADQLDGATVRIAAGYDSGADTLILPPHAGIAATFDAASGTLTLTGDASAAAYEAALRDVRFDNDDDTPSTAARTVAFQVDDGDPVSGASNVATRGVTVAAADDPPVAVADAATLAEDAPATALPVLANDTDAEGDARTIASATQPADGAVVVTGGGSGLTYEPDADFAGEDTFTYTLDGGSSATVTVTVTPVEDDPVAVDDAATVAEDAGATAIGVLANDPDVDGGLKAITAAGDPAHGTVAFTATGLTYAPDADYAGADTFTYTLNGGATATVTVTVTPVDDPPVAVDDSETLAEDAPATALGVLANDTDIDAGPKTLSIASAPAHGEAAVTGGGSGLTYRPDADWCGTDTLAYALNGGSSATVTVTVTCVNDAPVADDESFTGANGAIGNTTLVVDDPSDGAPTVATPRRLVTGDLLAGDTDVETPAALAVVPETKATAGGGEVTIEADGDFTYLPEAGCADATDTFTYLVGDGALTDAGTVTIAVTDCVWYAAPGAAPGGDGRSDAPFDTLTALGGTDPDRANDTIFLYGGTYTGTLALENGQRLLSQRHGLAVDGTTLVASGGGSATLTGTLTLGNGTTVQGVSVDNAAGPGLVGTSVGTTTVNTATSGMTLRGAPAVDLSGGTLDVAFATVTSSGSAGNAIALANTGGTFAAPGGSLQNAAGATVQLTGGALDFTYGGTIADATGVAVAVSGATGGTKDFNGAITGGGVALTGNGGATIRFDGGLALSTAAANAFAATGGGTVAVTGTNTLQTTSGTPLTVTNTAIHGDDLTFRSIASSGAPSGIVLTNTGAAGGLTVTGTGAADSGGTISGSTGPGVALDAVAGGVSLTRMAVQNGADDGVRGTNVTGLVLDTTKVTGNGTATGEHGLDLTGLSGAVNLTGATVTGNFERNVSVGHDAGTLTFTVSGGTYGNTNETLGSDGIAVEGTGSGTITVGITGATFTNNRGDHVQVTTDASTTVRENVTISGNTMSNPVGQEGGGITLNPGGNAVMKAVVEGNGIQGARDGAIVVDTPGSRLSPQPATIDATIRGNTVGTAGFADSGASAGNGIVVSSNGMATIRALVESNTVHQYTNVAGLRLVSNDGNGTLDATVRSNVIATPGTGAQNAIASLSGGADALETAVSCLNLGDAALPLMNQLWTGGTDLAGGEDIRIVRRDKSTVRIAGYAGGLSDTAAVGAFVAARNTAGGTPTVAVLNTGTDTPFAGGSCTLPQP